MNPHSLDFTSPHSTRPAPKRRILGELQNIPSSPFERLKSNENSPLHMSPLTIKSPLHISPLNIKSPLNMSQMNIKSPLVNSPLKKSPISIASPLMNSPLTSLSSPLLNSIAKTTFHMKRGAKITKIYEERIRFKENKENIENQVFSDTGYRENAFLEGNENAYKFDLGEEARDGFGAFQEETSWSAKLDFTNSLPPGSPVPGPSHLDDLETLRDLEAYEPDLEACSKYEIISTDSPNVISHGRATTRKVVARNFEFGAPLADCEQSTSFNQPPTTRVLNFEDSFEFPSPALKRSLVKKSLKFNDPSSPTFQTGFESPLKCPLRHDRSDSSIGSMSSSLPSPKRYTGSPTKLRLYPSDSTTSMESGFISELDEPFLDIEDSSSPKIANFSDLLSGPIKDNIITDKGFVRRPALVRSLSFQPEMKRIQESSEEKRKREEGPESSNKRRRSNCSSAVERTRPPRPVLHRALSENNAAQIKSALARSACSSDLIGDYSAAHRLPLAPGDHADLKSITPDTLAALLQGQYSSAVSHYQIIDCRYPYEFTGGHIQRAVNMHAPAHVRALLSAQGTDNAQGELAPRGSVLVFHCEYSIERGPKLYRLLRAADRSLHSSQYPSLLYPEMYLLQGGYRAFHERHPALCSGAGYTAMTDPTHRHLLRRHRSQDSHKIMF